MASLLDAYSFAATKAILKKARAFTHKHDKKLMVILLDPYRVTRPLLEGDARAMTRRSSTSCTKTSSRSST